MWWVLLFPAALLMQWAISLEANLELAEPGFERRAMRILQLVLVLLALFAVVVA